MRLSLRVLVPVLVAGVAQIGPAQSAVDPPASAASNAKALAAYARLSLTFVPNRGQSEARVRYQAQAGGASFSFMRGQVVLSFAKGERGHALALQFVGANPTAEISARRPLPGRVNYLLGNDPSKWTTGLRSYGELVYRELWPGIDLAFRGERGRLKYEFRLRPGARVERIRLAYKGAEGLSVTPAGALAIDTPLGVLTDAAPETYQSIQGKQQTVTSRYVTASDNTYRFAVGSYDVRHPIVIDPGLAYSTFLGGTASEGSSAIAIDASGSAYVVGTTDSTNFPTTPGAFDRTKNGDDAFVAKLNPSGSGLVYSTFLGGTGGESGSALALDEAGNAYVAGRTTGVNFPTTPGAFDTTYNGGHDAFVTKLNAAGSALVYSTFLGGTNFDSNSGIAVDAGQNAYVIGTTYSADFPITPGSFDETRGGPTDSYVARLDAAGSVLVYATFLGGTGSEAPHGVTVDPAGNAYVTGQTHSADFPTTPGAFDPTYNGDQDAFVAKLNAAGTALVYSTFLGGTDDDYAEAIALDASGNAYVAGFTISASFPTTPGAFDTTYNGGDDAFVTKLNAVGSALVYSTFLGATNSEGGSGIDVDEAGNAYVVGSTRSSAFPTTPDAFDRKKNGRRERSYDAFVSRLNVGGSGLVYSTFLGGGKRDAGGAIAVDAEGNAYVTGNTESSHFPTTPAAFDVTYNGSGDVFVTKVPT